MNQFRTDQQLCFSFFPEQQVQHRKQKSNSKIYTNNYVLDSKRISQINWAREYREFQDNFFKRGYPEKSQDWTMEFQQKKRQLSKNPSLTNIQYHSPQRKPQQTQKRQSHYNINKYLDKKKPTKTHFLNSYSKKTSSEQFQEWKQQITQNKENVQIQNEEPLLYVNIHFRDILDSIIIYKNDSIEKLMQEFVNKHRLSDNQKDNFQRKFLAQMHELLQSN